MESLTPTLTKCVPVIVRRRPGVSRPDPLSGSQSAVLTTSAKKKIGGGALISFDQFVRDVKSEVAAPLTLFTQCEVSQRHHTLQRPRPALFVLPQVLNFVDQFDLQNVNLPFDVFKVFSLVGNIYLLFGRKLDLQPVNHCPGVSIISSLRISGDSWNGLWKRRCARLRSGRNNNSLKQQKISAKRGSI